MIAVIMAGGEGSRLRPLTCGRPKPLVPVCNQPILTYTLDLLADHGFQEVFLTLGYMPDAIRRAFGERYRGLRLHYAVEEQPLGTAGGVAALKRFLTETFLVISGDALTDIDLGELIRFHHTSGALATLALTRVEAPLEYGLVMTDRQGRVRRFLEKPGWGEVFSDTVNTGIYVLEPAVLQGVPAGRPYDFSQHLFPSLLHAEAPLYARVCSGYWCDIGGTETYLRANLDLLSGRLTFRPPGRQVAPGVWAVSDLPEGITVDGPALIASDCRLAPGTRLEAGVVLGAGCEVGPGSILRRTVVADGVRVGAEAALVGAIACENVQIGDRAGVFEGAVVGAGAVLGDSATVAPGIRIWPGICVGSGARVETTLIQTPHYQSPVLRGGALRGAPGADLLPEAAMRLGMAFGAVLENPGPVVLGVDPTPGAGLLAQALRCGLMAVGHRVLDLGTTAFPVTAFTIRDRPATGGLHVRSDGRQARVVLYDAMGRTAGRSLQRKVEQAMERQDFLRAAPEAAGEAQLMSGAEERYLDWLSTTLSAGPPPTVSLELTGLTWRVAERLFPSPPAPTDRLTVRIDPLQETWRVMGATAEQMLALELFLQARLLCPGGPVQIPVIAPQAVEAWLRRAGYGTLRIRQSDWQPADPLLMIGTLLAWMSEESLSVQDLLRRLPVAHTAAVTVACPWEAKGRIMRALLEEHGDGLVELLDGLRIKLPDGAALLLPDPEEPVYRILTEGENPERAAALAQKYAHQVQRLLGT